MRYYEVWVASQRYHGESSLTYSHEAAFAKGTLVTVELQRQVVVAVVLSEVKKPSFKTKPIRDTLNEEPIPSEIIELMQWVHSYYPAPLGQITSLALPGTLTTKSRAKTAKTVAKFPEPLTPPALTTEQAQAIRDINQPNLRTALLHGNTGSGKTRVYIELIDQQLKRDKSVLLLTPEISLTPQLAQSVHRYFPGSVVVLHSEMTVAQRRNAWLSILTSTKPLVVIGPRSILFCPLKSIGLIVLDEFHETAYKQEQAPHYLATRVAARLASLHGAQLIFGSATPLLADYYFFKQKKLSIIRMVQPALFDSEQKTDVVIIDLKKREQFNRSPWISNTLIEGISIQIQKEEQSLVFLNRRGSARLILCQNCGWEAVCPRCDLPLTYHADMHSALCHTCGFRQNPPSSCPECSSTDINFKSIGTKALVTELARLFPQARIQRFDSDLPKIDRMEHHYENIVAGNVDILVGTQMLGKGLDLPKLGLLGIIQADTSLSFPDYTAQERTYQLLSQALGRLTRGHRSGLAVIQTHHTDNPILRAAIEQDYASFYDCEIKERQTYNFPPFCFLLKITCSRASLSAARQSCESIGHGLRKSFRDVQVIGPAPSFLEKTNNRYNWQLVVKSKKRTTLIDIIRTLPQNCSYDIDPTNLL